MKVRCMGQGTQSLCDLRGGMGKEVGGGVELGGNICILNADSC